MNREFTLLPLALVAALCVALSGCGGKEERRAMHMEKARAYYAQSVFEKAKVELRNVLQIEPRSADAYELLGRIEEEQQNWQNAFNDYRQAVEINPTDVDAKVRLARLYVFSGAIDQSEKIADGILAKDPNHPGALFLRAAILTRRGDVAAAIDEANRALVADPSQVDAASLLGGLYSRQGDDTKAQAVLEAAVKIHPKNIPLRMDLGSILVKRKAFDQAEALYRDVVAMEPAKLAYRANLAAFYTSTGQPDKAEKTLRDAVEAAPDDTERYVMLVDFLAASKGADKAEQALTAAIQSRPRATALRFSLARLYELTDHPDKAEQTYREIIASERTGPDGLRARTQLARLQAGAGDVPGADRLIGEVVKENPRDSGALQLRAQMALAKGDARQAIADLRSLVKDHPDSAELVSLLARAHAMNNEPALARNVIDNAIARYPHDAALRVALADLLVFSHRDDEAARELDAALEIDPGNVRALQLRADFETSRKQWNAAEQTLGRLKAALPQQPIGYYRMGLVYQAQGQYDRARAEYETALAKAPLAAEPLAALVKLFMAQGKPDKAIARLNQALAVSPGSAIPHVLLGEVYRHENRYADAEAELRKALQIDRRAPRAYGTLATLYFSQGERNAALALLEEGVSANPQDALLPHALAEMYQRLGQMDKAIAEYERILARTPADDVAANNLASLLTDTKGDPESLQRALALAKRFDNASNPSLLDTLGWIYLKLGDTRRAVTLLQKAAEAAPLSPVYQYHLGMALYRQGDVKSAKAHLRRAVEAKTAFAGIDQARDVLARM